MVLRGRVCYHSLSALWQCLECHPTCQVKQIFSSNYQLEWFYVGAAVITAPVSIQNCILLAR
jgi:hypothetical protein